MTSWLRNSPFRASITRQPSRTVIRADSADPTACYDSFIQHWQQALKIILRSQELPAHDDVLGVVNHLEQIVALLVYDLNRTEQMTLPTTNTPTPCLEYLLSENILEKLYDWGIRTGRYANAVRLEELKLYENLVSQSRQQLLVHEPFLRPLLKLLASCQGEVFPPDVEKRLVTLLNQLCVLLMQNIDLLDLFFITALDSRAPRFIIFSLLIPFIHRDGAIGMQARDALLLCMSLSRKNKNVRIYISDHTNICVLLASGLSGLYSVLPHTLDDIESEDWHCFTPDDVNDIKDLAAFMNSLEFSNAVAQVAHPIIREQLLDYLYKGFLIPVMGPALLQTSVKEQLAATAYFDLLLRSVTEPGLLISFVQFLLEVNYDGKKFLDILISRINNNSRLSLISLALFHTLVDLNCEDIMLELVFKHLQPCLHLMSSQRNLLHDLDPYCQNVEKFLSLSPNCCQYLVIPETHKHRSSFNNLDQKFPGAINWNHYGGQTGESLYGNYHAYLCDARNKIASCRVACSTWSNKYDGCDTQRIIMKLAELDVDLDFEFNQECNNTDTDRATTVSNGTAHPDDDAALNDENLTFNSLQSLGESSGYESLMWKSEEAATAEQSGGRTETPVWRISQVDRELPVVQAKQTEDGANPGVGLFLHTLLEKLENMMSNNLYINLHLTGLLSRLAVYSQPLLRTYLLNHKLVLQPNVRSLFQILGSLKQKIDEYMNRQTDAGTIIKQAKWFLVDRETRLLNARKKAIEGSTVNSLPNSTNAADPFKRDESKRRSLTSSLSLVFRRTSHADPSLYIQNKSDDAVESSVPTHQASWYRENAELKNVALCAVILDEWLKELAALSQEHTIAQLTTIINN